MTLTRCLFISRDINRTYFYCWSWLKFVWSEIKLKRVCKDIVFFFKDVLSNQRINRLSMNLWRFHLKFIRQRVMLWGKTFLLLMFWNCFHDLNYSRWQFGRMTISFFYSLQNFCKIIFSLLSFLLSHSHNLSKNSSPINVLFFFVIFQDLWI